jgi:Glycosyltransferase (GlcNAc)
MVMRRKRDILSVRNNAPTVLSSRAFRFLVILVFLALLTSLGTTFMFLENPALANVLNSLSQIHNTTTTREDYALKEEEAKAPQHLQPRLPYLPAFPVIDNKDTLMHQTLHDNKPTIAGIAAILYDFLDRLHQSNLQLASSSSSSSSSTTTVDDIRAAYFRLVQRHLMPLETAYRGHSIFPRRDDDSIFVSIAAFREYLLQDTLQSLFSSAKNPHKVFVGVVVNNCWNDCYGAVKVVGKDKMGKDQLQNVDGVADVNHIESFCSNDSSLFAKYCDAGQVRVLYVNETEALGPAVARYYSSKLWGGETFYVQIDSHLHFATHWDELYIQDIRLAKSYPKAILSTYPPGFVNFRQEPPFTPGTRLCRCQMRREEDFLPRVEMEGRCSENQSRPTRTC